MEIKGGLEQQMSESLFAEKRKERGYAVGPRNWWSLSQVGNWVL
jgi:hypothetical protein